MIRFLKKLFVKKIKLDTKLLPSQGLFYKEDFVVSIRVTDEKDILDYEKNYIKDDIGSVIHQIKKIVESNISLSKGYVYNDIKSIDIIFIFLEIVKLTKGKPISLVYFDKNNDIETKIEFGTKYFNYYKISNKIMKFYDSNDRSFSINGYK